MPAGFCVTTAGFQRATADAPSLDEQLDRLSRLEPDDRKAIRALSAEIRQTLEGVAFPEDVAASITHELVRLGDSGENPDRASANATGLRGERAAYAVRSSATAEDLPAASFAGQQDTFLNVFGPATILRHVSRCWASLFTERAVTYRLRNGIDHRKVRMAVVVQQMVFPRAAGTLFTADPITSNRKVACVEASFGLGEGLVTGLVNPDVYRVRTGRSSPRRSPPSGWRSKPRRRAARKSGRSIPSGRNSRRCRTRRSCGSHAWADASKRTSVTLRTSNGAWSTTRFTSSRADRSPRCSRSPRPAIERTTSTSPSVTSR